MHTDAHTVLYDREGQLDQRLHQTIRAENRVGGLEERIRSGVEAAVELDTKVGQHVQRRISGTC
ncbi:hypothetical protein [Streptomyces sp. SID13588]|uniref:hypothetical protein n=1 Tax=Streptomyces sp. SID13588 TaxID=2706051 RepID=UPI0013C99417|nr:hypothetical protein [Streptomyces sp. SID13588]NEA73848.1 hypothetical protein [Streptomyces sp. SID13588]